MQSKVLILDFGSQVTKLIARNIRELNVYCEIIPYNSSLEKIKSMNPDCLILSGSPASIYDKKPPLFDERILNDKLPILGICYGAQLISKIFKSNVKKSKIREFGPSKLIKFKNNKILQGIKNKSVTWMSHGDTIVKLGSKLQVLAKSEFGSIALYKHKNKNIYGTQFHPEVVHTPFGKRFLSNLNFLMKIIV